MTRINYPSTSQYSATPQSDFRIGFYVDRKIAPASTDRLIQVATKYQYRPDRLAHDLWGVSGLWWVIMARNINLIRDPIYDLRAGMQIMVPTFDTITAALGVK